MTSSIPVTNNAQASPPAQAQAEPKPPAAVATPQGAPVEYQEFRVPEGAALDKAALSEALPVFKALNLTQEQAQTLVDFHAKQVAALGKAPAEAYAKTRAEWQAAVLADPEIRSAQSGGAVGIEAVKADIGRALSAMGDPTLAAEFRHAMNITGAGDHPAFVKAFWKLSRLVSEGTPVTGGGVSPHGQSPGGVRPRPTIASALYPTLPQ